MIIRRLKDCPEFISNDGARLRELLNAQKDDFRLGYSFAHAIVNKGMKTKPHKLKASEVYYIVEGRGLMHIGQESDDVVSGDTIYIPPNAIQYIENTGSSALIFLCIVDPAWRPEYDEVV